MWFRNQLKSILKYLYIFTDESVVVDILNTGKFSCHDFSFFKESKCQNYLFFAILLVVTNQGI